MLLFCAAATLLPWTLVSIRASAGLLVGVAALAAGARARRAMLEEYGEDPASSATLSRGVEHLEQAFEPPEEDPQAAELERVQRELLQVHTRLAQAQREGASDAARTAQLERRIDKLLKLVQQTEDELRRVSRMKAIDPGQASIYRNVQGLDDLDDQYEVKAELLGAIFEANLQLRRDSNAQAARQSA